MKLTFIDKRPVMPLSMKHLLVLLLCCLEIFLAGAVDDFTQEDLLAITFSGGNLTPQQYENISGWNWLVPSHAQEQPIIFASSVHPEELGSLHFSLNDLFVIEERDRGIQLPKSASMDYSYLREIDGQETGKDDLLSRPSISTSSPELQYIQKSDKAQKMLLDYSSSLGILEESNIAFMDSEVVYASLNKISDIKTSPDREFEDILRTSDSYNLQLLNPERIAQVYEASLSTPLQIGASPAQPGNQILNPFSGSLNSYKMDRSSAVDSYFPERLPSPRNKKELKNYAIVVGIDQYDDRMNLRTCANDARSMADLMREMGYDVVLLSDQTDEKPTKENILKKAFDEIRDKQNVGNVVFYFSGHGIKTKDDIFYLIPQDANGDVSTYISESELKEKINNIKNLAMIIDACNSEGLGRAMGEGQLIIASSRYNESSNVEWTGSLSVFTSYLIKAIQEEKQRSNRVLLRRCFDRAYSDTVRWSRSHLISQTPVMIDKTDGIYYIN